MIQLKAHPERQLVGYKQRLGRLSLRKPTLDYRYSHRLVCLISLITEAGRHGRWTLRQHRGGRTHLGEDGD